jgi:hypothetical protein
MWRRIAGIVLTLTLGMIVFAPGVRAHVTSTFTHLWNDHIEPLLATPGTINAAENPVHWTKLKGVPAGLADGLDNGVDNAGFGLDRVPLIGGGSAFSVDATQVQRRLTGSCAPGAAIRGINQAGGVTCSQGPAAWSIGINDSGIICNSWCSEGTHTLPAGSYMINAKIEVRQTINLAYLEVNCRLDVTGAQGIDRATIRSPDEDQSLAGFTVPLMGVATFTGEGNVVVACKDDDIGDAHGGWVRIQAIRLA